MNAGIVTSFVIGGLLLLSILFMNMSMSRSSASLTMRQMTQQNVQATSQILTHDISKIGFNRFKKINNPIVAAESTKVKFQSNLDNSTNGSVELIEWHFDTSTEVTSGSNPDDHILRRTVDGNTTDITMGITSFKLTYLDKNLNPTTAKDEIRHIKVDMRISSKEGLGKIGGGAAEYTESIWSKTFTPKNIQ